MQFQRLSDTGFLVVSPLFLGYDAIDINGFVGHHDLNQSRIVYPSNPMNAQLKTFSTLALALCLAGFGTAQGAVVQYFSQATFNAAVTQAAGSPITFEGLTAPGTYTQFGGPMTISGVTFNDPFVYANNQSSTFGPNANDLSTDFYGNGNYVLTLTLPSGVSAFGSNLISGAGITLHAVIDVFLTGNAGPTPDFTLQPTITPIYNDPSIPIFSGTPVFYGFTVSGGTIDHLVFASNGPTVSSPGFDNLEFGTFSAVPEPGTYVLMMDGIGALVVLARRRASQIV